MSDMSQTERRKLDHIRICVDRDVEFDRKETFFRGMELSSSSFPDINLEDVDTSIEFLGEKLSAPIFVTAITGGEKSAEKVNRDIAKATDELNLGMGLGSQRAMLEDCSLTFTYDVRSEYDPAFLLGNIGIAQLNEYDREEFEWLVDEVSADALAVHVNPAQEAVQPEGDTDFEGCLEDLISVSKGLDYPVILKQVGEGISRNSASDLNRADLYAVDVGGAGGSSWTKIDNFRSEHSYGDVFREWGVPTAQSLIETKRNYKGRVTATGGIRNGLDIAKAICLGAEACGVGLPVLRAQQKNGSKGVEKFLKVMVEEFKIAMFLNGSENIKGLREKDLYIPRGLRDRLDRSNYL